MMLSLPSSIKIWNIDVFAMLKSLLTFYLLSTYFLLLSRVKETKFIKIYILWPMLGSIIKCTSFLYIIYILHPSLLYYPYYLFIHYYARYLTLVHDWDLCLFYFIWWLLYVIYLSVNHYILSDNNHDFYIAFIFTKN
jgi:hypothetical protein